uniref:Uncharacterized protein n=1 Tax=Anguilla anguilla TaxID=7936 RepID=A0A0E9PD18_ANGAN
MGFRSGLWLGHSKMLILFSVNHFLTTLAVCFGFIVLLESQVLPKAKFSADCLMFSSRTLI